MKVTYDPYKDSLTYKDLPPGAVFTFKGGNHSRFYIKTALQSFVDLGNGILTCTRTCDDDPVTHHQKAELVVNGVEK